MNRLFLAGLLLAATCCAGSCGSRSSKPSAADGMQADNAAIAPADSSLQVTPTYAEGYTIDYRADGVRLLDVHDPQNPEAPGYHFALVPRGTHPAGIPQDYTPIETPVRSVICMTSLQLSNFIALDACPLVTGITSTRHLFNPTMTRQLAEGRTVKIGIEGNFDSEVVMSVEPDVIFISPLYLKCRNMDNI